MRVALVRPTDLMGSNYRSKDMGMNNPERKQIILLGPVGYLKAGIWTQAELRNGKLNSLLVDTSQLTPIWLVTAIVKLI